MQVTLGRKGDYSVRAVLNLARHYGNGRRKSREIAAEMDIPERYLPQILANLVRHRLLVAMAGPDGGYALARDPAEVSLFDVVEAAEGALEGTSCMLRGGPCDWTDACPMHEPWTRAQGALANELRITTFRDLAAVDAAIEEGAYNVPSGHAIPTPREGVRGGSAPPQPATRRKPAAGKARR